ncbi:MAG: anaerobic C4-dicarboxylate transporter [Campylobacteraceae bacterium]
MIVLQIVTVLAGIFIGVRLGGIGIGYAGGLALIVLCFVLGLRPGGIAVDVILIIASVISAIAAMQVAGGLDYLVSLTEKLLRKNPKHINFLAPAVTYLMTILAGTGHTAYAALPVITEVAKEQNIKPSVPLSLSVVTSQIAITASPIAAAFMAATGALEKFGVSYLTLLSITIPTTFVACMITCWIIAKFSDLDLTKDPVFQERLKKGLVKYRGEGVYDIKPGAKLSVWLFLAGVAAIIIWAILVSPAVGLFEKPPVTRDQGIYMFMLSVGALITIFCKIDLGQIANSSTFKAGMVAVICILGVAWLGSTLVEGHMDAIKAFATDILNKYPWLLAVVFYFLSALLYSQAVTSKLLIPVALMIGVSPITVVASFAAVSGLFILPTYPTLIAAVQMDDTGSTRIGKFIFNHPFIIPGTLMVTLSVIFGFLLAPVLI